MMKWLTRPAPDPIFKQYLQGGRVQYKPGGLVEPGVTHYAKRTQQEVNAIKQNIRNYYNNAIKILKRFGLEKIRLLTNNPSKVEELDKRGITVEPVTHKTEANKENREYLETKASKMKHLLDF